MHPAVNFPGRTQENILLTLLRKKREPGVEERVERGLETTAEVRAQTAAAASDAGGGAATGLGDLQDGIQILEEVWSEVAEWTKQRVETYVMEEAAHVYTKKEREMGIENVKSGLRRPLREPGGDDDDEDEESEEEGNDDEPGKDEDVVMGEGPGQGQSQSSQPGRQAVPEPELLFWFAARGDYDLPKNVELEKDAARRARMGGGGGMPRM